MTKLKLQILSRQQINEVKRSNPAKLKTFPNTNTKTNYKIQNKIQRYNKRQQVVGETNPGNPPPVVTKLLLRQDDGDDEVDGDGDGDDDDVDIYIMMKCVFVCQ